MNTTVNGIILAGGDAWGEYPTKAMVPVAGVPMVCRVAQAMMDSGVVDRIVAVGPCEALRAVLPDNRITVLPQVGRLIENIGAAVDALQNDDFVVCCTADAPALTPESVADAVQAGLAAQAEAVYTFVEKSVIEKAFPGAKRTYVRLKTGRMTGGNLTMFCPKAFTRNRELLEDLMNNRKSPVKLARILGMRTLLNLALGRLTVEEGERAGHRLIGAKVFAYQSPYAEIGQDVDRPEDVAFMEQFIKA